MQRSTLHAVVLAALLISGCSSTPPPRTTVSPPSLGSDLPGHGAAEPLSPRQELRGTLSLPRALGSALLHNPSLLVFSWEIRAREAEALQAGLRPNPELGAEFENFGGTGVASGFDGTETTLTLSQLAELGGKRSKRLAAASLDRDLAAWEYEAARIDVLTETTRAFVEVVVAQEQVALADELVQVASSVLEAVSHRVQAGAISPVEESRARVALETSRIERIRRSKELSIARNVLAAQWGGTEAHFTAATANLDRIDPLPELSLLYQTIEQTPTLARWNTEIASRRAERELADSRGTPDLNFGAGLRHFGETGDTGAVIGLSLRLPVFDRNQGARAAAEARVLQAEQARRAATVAARAKLQAEHAEAESSYEEAVALRDRIVPEAQTAFRLAQEAYDRGRMKLTDVLDAERTLFDLRTRQVETVRRYHTAIAELERLAGVPLTDLSQETRRQ